MRAIRVTRDADSVQNIQFGAWKYAQMKIVQYSYAQNQIPQREPLMPTQLPIAQSS